MSDTYAEPTTATPAATAALEILTGAANALANAIYELQCVLTPPEPLPALADLERHILEAAFRSASGKFGLKWLRNAVAPFGSLSNMTDDDMRDALRDIELPTILKP